MAVKMTKSADMSNMRWLLLLIVNKISSLEVKALN